MTQVQTTRWDEVGFVLTGTLTPAEPDVGIAGPGIEDADIAQILLTKTRWIAVEGGMQKRDEQVNILEGIDTSRGTPGAKLIDNILTFLGTDVDEALLEEAAANEGLS